MVAKSKRTGGPAAQAAETVERLTDPAAELSPTAMKLLEAARRIVARDGFPGLTLEAIQAESGMNKSLVWYHFGGKSGLIATLVAQVEHEYSRLILDEIAKGTDVRRRLDVFIEQQNDPARGAGEYTLFFELLPHILRDPELRARFGEVFDRYRQLDRRTLTPDDSPPDAPELEALSYLTVAVADGLAIQYAADPDVDLRAALALWKRIISSVLDDLESPPD
jgi:AcrR family transcriptional regulator